MNSTSCVKRLLDVFKEEYTTENIRVTQYFCDNRPLLNNGNMLVNNTETLRTLCCNDSSKQRICFEILTTYEYDVAGLCPVRHYYENPLEPYDATTYILLSLLVPIGLIGNFLILFAIIRLRCLPRQTGNFLGSLACADIGVILQYLFWFASTKIDLNLPLKMSQFLLPSIDIFFAALSLLQITIISVERAVAVTWPLKYPSYISTRRSKFIVFGIWSTGLFFFMFSMSRVVIDSKSYWDVVFYINTSFLLFVPLITVIISYTMVLTCAYKNLSQDRKRLRMIIMLIRNQRRHSHDGDTSNNDTNNPNEKASINKRTSTIRCREIKLAINVAMIVLPFLGCWGFFLFIHLYEHITGRYFKNVINWLLPTLPFIVSCLNPVLYLLLTRSLRKSVKSLIKRKVKARLSRTEVSLLTLATNTNNNNYPKNTDIDSRKLSTGSNRKFGRDSTKDMESLEELVKKLSTQN